MGLSPGVSLVTRKLAKDAKNSADQPFRVYFSEDRHGFIACPPIWLHAYSVSLSLVTYIFLLSLRYIGTTDVRKFVNLIRHKCTCTQSVIPGER